MSVRFHLDEHISAQIAAALRRRHIDVTTSSQVGLNGATDLEQLAFARSQDRVMVTRDSDFLRLHAERVEHAGIAFCPTGAVSIGQILHRLVLLHDVLTDVEMKNHLEFL